MIYSYIKESVAQKKKLLALLIDPDKCPPEKMEQITEILRQHRPHLLLVGGSLISTPIAPLVDYLKSRLDQPVILYPGNPSHLTPNVDGVLFLSMISGRNPELLRSEEHTSELQSRENLVCRLLLEKKKKVNA